MSGDGAPALAVTAHGAKVAIVASSWHTTIMGGLVAGAKKTCEAAGAQYELFEVAGSFELALIAQECARSGFDAVVALGVIIRGGTPHFEYVCQAATDALNHVSLNTAVPLGFGLLTVDTEQQGLDRAGLPESREDKGREATEAALLSLQLLRELRSR